MRRDTDNLRSRAWSASVLPRIRAPAELAVPPLIRALKRDPSDEVRPVAALSLEAYRQEAAAHDALRALLDTLDNPRWKVRGNAACALPALVAPKDPAAETLVSPLVKLVRDGCGYVRGCALRSLGNLRESVRRVHPELEALLDDEDPHMRREALAALGRP